MSADTLSLREIADELITDPRVRSVEGKAGRLVVRLMHPTWIIARTLENQIGRNYFLFARAVRFGREWRVIARSHADIALRGGNKR